MPRIPSANRTNINLTRQERAFLRAGNDAHRLNQAITLTNPNEDENPRSIDDLVVSVEPFDEEDPRETELIDIVVSVDQRTGESLSEVIRHGAQRRQHSRNSPLIKLSDKYKEDEKELNY